MDDDPSHGADVLKCFFSIPIRAMDEIDAIPVSVVALDQSTPLVGTPLVRQKTATRTVRTQKEINDADQAELAALELIPMGSLTEHRRTQLNAKIAKIKAKVNLYAFKIASQTEAVQSKKTRMSFESEDVMRLLDARRLQDHQFTDKAINNAETKKNLTIGDVLCLLEDSEGTARAGLSKYPHMELRATL